MLLCAKKNEKRVEENINEQIKKFILLVLVVLMTVIYNKHIVFAQNVIDIVEKIHADGSYTYINGITIYPNGVVKDAYGNAYNKDGSVTIANGTTYYKSGDVKDPMGIIYHADGSMTLSDGTTKDADGIIHHTDGSITLPDGTTYFVDGMVMSPGGKQINSLGEMVPVEETTESKEIPGSWYYEPEKNAWKYEIINDDGTNTTYTDQWINIENVRGEKVWYAADRDGYIVTGWLKHNGEYYFMSVDDDTRGELVKGTVTIEGKSYTFDKETGVLTSGEAPMDKLSVMGAKNHVSNKDGIWKVYDTGERYFVKYFDMPDGTRLEVPPSKWFMVDGHYYYFDKYGIPQTGLIVYDEKYYYLNEDGIMQEGGEVVIDNIVYVFDKATGACKTMRYH